MIERDDKGKLGIDKSNIPDEYSNDIICIIKKKKKKIYLQNMQLRFGDNYGY